MVQSLLKVFVFSFFSLIQRFIFIQYLFPIHHFSTFATVSFIDLKIDLIHFPSAVFADISFFVSFFHSFIQHGEYHLSLIKSRRHQLNCLLSFHQHDQWNAFLNWMMLPTSFLLGNSKKKH